MKPQISCARRLEDGPSVFIFPPLACLSDLLANSTDVDVRNVYGKSILIENGNDVLPIRVNVVQGALVDAKLPLWFLAEFGEARPLKAVGNGGVFVRCYKDIL